jgi:type IV secretory pathway VirJ component
MNQRITISFKKYSIVIICITINSIFFTSYSYGQRSLPIMEFPVESNQKYFVLFFSGDGGWKTIDKSLTTNLNDKQVPVLALNSMKYLWSEKTPLQIAKDMEFLIDRYLKKWNKQYVVIMGYSLGAEVLPFAINRLNQYYLPKIKDLILIAPSQRVLFKIKVKEYLIDNNEGLDVLPEIKKLKIATRYCICDDKKYSLCKQDLSGIIEYSVLTGGHHFDGDYSTLNKLLSKRLNLD